VAPKGKALRVFFSVTPPGRKAGKGTEMNTHGMLVSHPSILGNTAAFIAYGVDVNQILQILF
jgi:hypothetical protein